MNDPDPNTPEPGPDAGADDIRADIEATRHELGETVEALSAKLDVTHQAKQKVDDTKEAIADKAGALREKGSQMGARAVDVATDDAGSLRPAVPAAVLVVVAVIVGAVIWRRRR